MWESFAGEYLIIPKIAENLISLYRYRFIFRDRVQPDIHFQVFTLVKVGKFSALFDLSGRLQFSGRQPQGN